MSFYARLKSVRGVSKTVLEKALQAGSDRFVAFGAYVRLLSVQCSGLACLLLICLAFGSRPAGAIIRGTNANWQQYPWLAMNVAIFPGQTQWQDRGCTSILIDRYYALTAGHCLNGPYNYPVGLKFSDGTVIQVAQEIRNPNYVYDPLHYKYVYGVVSSSVADIGLQRLARPVDDAQGWRIYDLLGDFDDNYHRLPQDLVGQVGTVVGWGSTSEAQTLLTPPSTFSPTLQGINESVQESATCETTLSAVVDFLTGGVLTTAQFQFSDDLFCATPVGLTIVPPPQTPTDQAGVCTGDSGPLFQPDWSHPKLIGLVTDELSLGIESPCGNGIDIYTKIAPYAEWITSVVRPQGAKTRPVGP
jgi:secreted trypsin-like serine protease